MPRVVSSQTLDAMRFVAGSYAGGANVMRDGGDVEQGMAVDYIRETWPGVTPRDLLVAGVALAFFHDALTGAVPRRSGTEYAISLLKTECENLKAHGLSGVGDD